jgi:serine/threonine protein kinase
MLQFAEGIAGEFPAGELVQQGSRNVLRRFAVGGRNLVVKRFGRPNAVNRVAYTFLRKPKGQRAYEYALRMLGAGFDTPEPVAYIEYRRWGMVSDSYFVSAECTYSRRFYEFGNADVRDCEDIVRAFARYAAAFHEAGMLHRDFSPGNILFDKVDGEWKFSFVDINRMHFGPVDVKTGCRNFARLWGQLDFFRVIADEYAKARHADAAECFATVRAARRAFWTRFARRHKVKYRLEL